MKKKILVPTDFSKNAWQAITYGIELFQNEPCEFYLLNAYGKQSNSDESEKNKSLEGLDKLLKQIKLRNDNLFHEFTLVSKKDSLRDSVMQLLEEENITLVIMGTKGATEDQNIIFGSNTTAIMEHVQSCPVLAIPEEAWFREFKEIVVAADFKLPFESSKLKNLIDLAKINRSAIRICHLSETQQR